MHLIFGVASGIVLAYYTIMWLEGRRERRSIRRAEREIRASRRRFQRPRVQSTGH